MLHFNLPNCCQHNCLCPGIIVWKKKKKSVIWISPLTRECKSRWDTLCVRGLSYSYSAFAYLVYKKNCIRGCGHVNGGSTHDEELKSSLTDTGGVWATACTSGWLEFCCDFGDNLLDGRPMALALLWAPVTTARAATGAGGRALVDGIWNRSGVLTCWPRTLPAGQRETFVRPDRVRKFQWGAFGDFVSFSLGYTMCITALVVFFRLEECSRSLINLSKSTKLTRNNDMDIADKRVSIHSPTTGSLSNIDKQR